jgi:hypothetical protein
MNESKSENESTKVRERNGRKGRERKKWGETYRERVTD